MAARTKNRPTPDTRKRARKVNEELHELGKHFHDSIPVTDIDAILTKHGFSATEPAIYCGRVGKSHEHVGDNLYLTLNWYKMEETGRYEIVAYLN